MELNKVEYGKAFNPTNFNTSMTEDDINNLRKPYMNILSYLNSNKHKIRSEEYQQLLNYNYYILNILDNMINIKKVEMSDPYNINMHNVMGGNPIKSNKNNEKLSIISLSDGRTKIIDNSKNRPKKSWEAQFDMNLINPPSYSMPPTNCWNIDKLK